MTEISLFMDKKPTWDIVGFNDDISRIPHMVKGFRVDDFRQDAVYANVIGDSLVYRRFATKCRMEDDDGIDFIFSITPTNEVERYVFGSIGLFIEKPDKTMALIKPDMILIMMEHTKNRPISAKNEIIVYRGSRVGRVIVAFLGGIVALNIVLCIVDQSSFGWISSAGNIYTLGRRIS